MYHAPCGPQYNDSYAVMPLVVHHCTMPPVVPSTMTPMLCCPLLCVNVPCPLLSPGQSVRLGEETMLPPRVVLVSDFNPTDDDAPFSGRDRADRDTRIKVSHVQIQPVVCF